MNEKLNNLMIMFDRFDDMQKAHIHAIKHCDTHLPDLSKYNFERSQTFEELKNQLVQVLKQLRIDHEDSNTAEICRRRYETIREQDNTLREALETYRTILSRDKQSINRGKKALRGYRGCASQSSPRVIKRPV